MSGGGPGRWQDELWCGRLGPTFPVSATRAGETPAPQMARHRCSPARDNAAPVRVDVFPHLRLVVALAIRDLLVAFLQAPQLVVVEFDAQPAMIMP